MHALGYITTELAAGPADGLGAMVGAWSCAREAVERGCAQNEAELMRQIAQYNELDYKVMMGLVPYLREHR